MEYLAEGGCLCGSIRYAVTSEPECLLHCGCSFCQRATGSHYLVEAIFPLDDLVLLSGKPKIFEFTSTRSARAVLIHFCETCGTKLYMSFDVAKHIYGVFAGTFDDPNWCPRPVDTTEYYNVEKMPDGVAIPAGYGVYYRHGFKLDGNVNTPQIFETPTVISESVRQAALEFARLHGEA